MINGALGVTKALAQTGVLAAWVIPSIIAMTAAQIGIIAAQKFGKGGVVPMGYPSDTYPAMLTSAERVLTPAQNRQYESSAANELKVKFEGQIRGTDIVFIAKEVQRRLNRSM